MMTTTFNSPSRVFMVRHGETELNTEGRLRGRLNPPLSDSATQNVLALARFLSAHQPSRIVTSPLLRSTQTAGVLGQHLNIEPVVDDDLIDRDYGRWAGELQTDVLDRWESLDAAPGVEPAWALRERAIRSLERQLPFLGDRPVVMVSHDAVITALLSVIDPGLGSTDQIPVRTASCSELRHTTDGWKVIQTDHRPSAVPGIPPQSVRGPDAIAVGLPEPLSGVAGPG